MTEKRRLWGKWVWDDWRKDMRLHRCSYGARGLWSDMLSVMGGQADVFGFLLVDGKAFDASDLAEEFGGKEREVIRYLGELREKTVFSITGDPNIPADVLSLIPEGMADGIIFSRRMLRDKHREEVRAQNGKRGGNPVLKGEVNHQDKSIETRGQSLEKKEDAAPRGAGAIAPSGSKPPSSDDQTWVFNEGLDWLAGETGRTQAALRSFVGKCRKALKNDDAQLRIAIEEASRQPKLANAIEWVTAAVKARAAAPTAPPAAARGFAPRQAQPALYEALDAEAEQQARVFSKTGAWLEAWGPKPGEKGCRLAPEVLARYGLVPAAALQPAVAE